MSILVACSKCSKKYKVDEKFAGKKAKCKACGAAFAVPAVAKSAEPMDDLLAGLHEAAASEHRVIGAPATNYAERAITRPGPAARSAARPSSRPAPRPPATEALDEGSPPVDVAPREDACPGCGKFLAPATTLCVSCGYSRTAGRVITTQVARPQGRSRFTDVEPDRDYQGFRNNIPYANTFVSFVCEGGVKLAWICYWGLYALGVIGNIGSIVRAARDGGGAQLTQAILGLIIGVPLSLFVYFVVFLPIVAKGLEIAGKIGKFQLPDEMNPRIVASSTYSGIVAAVFFLISAIGFAVVGPRHTDGDPAAMLAAALSMLILPFFAYCVCDFLLTWFFFRLRFVEALIAWPLKILFTVLAVIVVVGLFIALSFAIGFIIVSFRGGA